MRKYLYHAATGFGILFCVLAVLISLPNEIVSTMDSYGHMLALQFQTQAWSNIFIVVTTFGSTTGIIAGLITLMAIYRHRPDLIARLTLALLGTTITGEYLKTLFHRARPAALSWLQSINSYSFPSGHSSESMVLYGFLGILLYAHSSSKLRKFFAIIIPAVIILLVGFSRLALGYHYLSDVLGGYALGVFWITLVLAIPLYYQFYHLNSDGTEPIVRPVL